MTCKNGIFTVNFLATGKTFFFVSTAVLSGHYLLTLVLVTLVNVDSGLCGVHASLKIFL